MEEALDLSSDRILNEMKRTIAFQILFMLVLVRAHADKWGTGIPPSNNAFGIYICVHTNTHTFIVFFVTV